MRRYLYYVHANANNGANLDLLVWACDRGEAMTLWIEHYCMAEARDWEDCKIGQVPGVEGYAPSRVISWHMFSMMEMPK